MRTVIHVIIRAVTSLPALIIFTSHTAMTSFRYGMYCWQWLMQGKGAPDLELIDYSDVVSVRSIALGVLMLERHDILEYTRIIPKNSEQDSITETGNAYGAYYLCIGLIFEGMMMTFHMPERLLSGYIGNLTIITIGGILSAITCMASITLVASYLRLALANMRR